MSDLLHLEIHNKIVQAQTFCDSRKIKIKLKSLVTGGSGFLGGHLVEALVKRGEQVRVLVRPASKTEHLEQLGVELYFCFRNCRVA